MGDMIWEIITSIFGEVFKLFKNDKSKNNENRNDENKNDKANNEE